MPSKNILTSPEFCCTIYQKHKNSERSVGPIYSLRDPITYMYLKELWRNSILKVGTTKQMRHRAKIFKNLYLDNPRFYFGLSTAHLTLGIDRFAGMGKSLGKKLKWFKKRRLYKDLIIWGNELRQINQKMTQLIVFFQVYFEAKKDLF